MSKLLFVVLALFSITSQAVDIDASIGKAAWTRSDNGTWWQTPFKEEWPSSTTSWSLGLSDEINDNLRWNIGFTNLGVVKSYGEAVGDDIYQSTNGCITGKCPAPDQWFGTGSVEGVYFTLQPQITYHNIDYFVEIGVWNYQPLSVVHVPVQHPCGACGTAVEFPNQYFITSSDRMWGQIVGFGIGHKRLFAKLRAYWVDSNDKEYPATYQQYTYEASIGYRF